MGMKREGVCDIPFCASDSITHTSRATAGPEPSGEFNKCSEVKISRSDDRSEENLIEISRRFHTRNFFKVFGPYKSSRTLITVSFCEVNGMKPCPDIYPNEAVMRIGCDTEATTPVRKEETTTLIRCPFFDLLTPG
ncbi:hypothetical protein TNCV_3845291 [Trichonephila clavipes]|nr:hypothetical protein TNCV_3845291 [Trichonephila clavipes]